MQVRVPTALVVGRALGGGELLVGALLAAALWRVVPERAISVLGRSDVLAVIWPLVPVVFAVSLPSAGAALVRDLEAASARSALSLRAAFLAGLVALGAGVARSGAHLDGRIALRNTGLLVGLALLATVLLPLRWAWAPVVMVPISMWLVGMRSGGVARSWALLMHQPGSRSAQVAAVCLFGAGIVAFLASGPRAETG